MLFRGGVYELQGVTSWGIGCATYKPGVYVKMIRKRKAMRRVSWYMLSDFVDRSEAVRGKARRGSAEDADLKAIHDCNALCCA